MNYLSLFSGIGGMDLGLDRAGWTCVGQVEIDPFCRTVLSRHWPEVPRHDDVRTAPQWWTGQLRPTVDAVVGGFPCQPFSLAGKQLGIKDDRWGWPWFRDAIRAVRPGYVVVENVRALLGDTAAFGRILGDLAEDGFNAEWSVLSACAMGAPHTRERLFIVAYTDSITGPVRLGRPAGVKATMVADDIREGARNHRVNWMETPPHLYRTSHGAARELDGPRLQAIGNAVVPDVAEYVGRMINDSL